MRIAIVSDIHDNIWNLRKAVEKIKVEDETVIFCGDFCSPFSAAILAETGKETYACLGNNDEDQIGLLQEAGDHVHWVALWQEFGEIELEGKKIAYCHYPKLAELLAKEGTYDAVFFGHTHQAQIKTIGKTLLVNPGAICGVHNAEAGPATYAAYETSSNIAEIIVLNE